MKKIISILRFYFVEPFNEIKKRQLDKGQSPLWRFTFILLTVVGFFTLICLSQDAGISGDEYYHYDHSVNVYNYYKTVGQDSTAAVITEKYNLPYYGQLVDNVAYFVTKTFGIDNYMEFRHGLNSVMGWLAVLFAALFAKRIGGWRVAVITMILMYISPRFIGHSFNNLKDLPLATATIMSIYYIVKFLDDLPNIKWTTAIMLVVSIAFAVSVRIGGLIVIAYFALFAIVYYIWKYKAIKTQFIRVLMWSLAISLVAYVIAVLTWPYAIQAPIDNPKETLGSMTRFAIALRQIFEGSAQWSDVLPWYYTPKFMLMTVPLVILLGLLIGIIMMFKEKKNWFYNFVLLFTFIFPVFWIVINKSNVYGGWRHAIFAYPSLVVFAGLGISTLIGVFSNKYIKATLLSVFALLCINPIAHCIRNHPYEYVYFNELEGGIKSAYGKYELDYYYHSMREAAEWIKQNAKKDNLTIGDKIVVGCWHPRPIEYYFKDDTNRFKVGFIRYYERGDSDWDYAIVCNTGIAPEQLLNGTFPPKNTVYEVKVDGKPICVVLKREDKSDYFASELKKKDSLVEAKVLYKKSLSKDTSNETALINLSEIYLRENNPDSVITLSDALLKISPKNESANYFKAYALFIKEKYDEAITICDQIIGDNFKNPSAYSLAASIKLTKRDLFGAEGYLNGLIAIDRIDNQGVQQLLAIYQAQGLDERNAYVKLYSMFVDHYKKTGNKEAAKQYEDAIAQIYNR